MSDNTIDQQFIEYIVTSLVANPDDVVVERKIDEKGVLLTLTVNPEDLGRVIGKRGATAQSMRTLLRALGTKQEARFNLKITDNGIERPDREEENETPREEVQEEQPHTEEKVQSEENDSWNSGSSSDDDDDEDNKEENESRFDRTRRELADLDDLDV